MPSASFIRGTGERSEALDEIENAHVMVGGTDRGRRYATQQINYASPPSCRLNSRGSAGTVTPNASITS